jgi:hypothetical protein
LKIHNTKRAGRVAEGVGPEFKPPEPQKKKKRKRKRKQQCRCNSETWR